MERATYVRTYLRRALPKADTDVRRRVPVCNLDSIRCGVLGQARSRRVARPVAPAGRPKPQREGETAGGDVGAPSVGRSRHVRGGEEKQRRGEEEKRAGSLPLWGKIGVWRYPIRRAARASLFSLGVLLVKFSRTGRKRKKGGARRGGAREEVGGRNRGGWGG